MCSHLVVFVVPHRSIDVKAGQPSLQRRHGIPTVKVKVQQREEQQKWHVHRIVQPAYRKAHQHYGRKSDDGLHRMDGKTGKRRWLGRNANER